MFIILCVALWEVPKVISKRVIEITHWNVQLLLHIPASNVNKLHSDFELESMSVIYFKCPKQIFLEVFAFLYCLCYWMLYFIFLNIWNMWMPDLFVPSRSVEIMSQIVYIALLFLMWITYKWKIKIEIWKTKKKPSKKFQELCTVGLPPDHLFCQHMAEWALILGDHAIWSSRQVWGKDELMIPCSHAHPITKFYHWIDIKKTTKMHRSGESDGRDVTNCYTNTPIDRLLSDDVTKRCCVHTAPRINCHITVTAQ